MKIVRGDIFSCTQGVIAHGCNSMGVMGSGVAKIVKEKYPRAFESYIQVMDDFRFIANLNPETDILGFVDLVEVGDGLYIANCITQGNYGRDPNTVYVSYEAVDQCFEELAIISKTRNLHIHFPFIGGGLGNGDRDTLLAIFEKHFPGSDGSHGTLWLL